MTAPTLVTVVGPTAAGKTALAVAVARRTGLPVEAVSLDSRQVYRGMDIGTGKPTPDELAILPHHLVDVVDPDRTVDAAWFRREAEHAITGILERGRVPVLVGGSGFYLRALVEGFFELPDDPERLASIRTELEARDTTALRDELAGVDPRSHDRIHPNDRYRTLRALEVHRLSGKTFSELEEGFQPTPILGARFAILHASPGRDLLHARIRARAEAWLRDGWPQEVARLRERYGPDIPGLEVLGYPEAGAVLDGRLTREEALERIVVATRRYARAQETWFRKEDARWRGDPADPAALDALETALRAAIP